MTWASGITTITHFNPQPTSDCFNFPPGKGCPAAGIDLGAAIPFAWFAKAGAHPGNCADGLTCHPGSFPVDRNGEHVCFRLTSAWSAITVLVTGICGGNCPPTFPKSSAGVCPTPALQQRDCADFSVANITASFDERLRCSPAQECSPYVKRQVNQIGGNGTWAGIDRDLVQQFALECSATWPPNRMYDWCSGYYMHMDLSAGNAAAACPAFVKVCGSIGANCAARYERIACPAIPESCMQHWDAR